VRQRLVVGNWKMHGSRASTGELVLALCQKAVGARAGVVICPPFPYLDQVGRLLQDSGMALGAQNVASAAAGAFTGEVSAGMLADFGCRYVIVGHSERRSLFGESKEEVAAKAARVLEYRMAPIVCVGETLAERRRGETLAVVGSQLAAVMDCLEGRQLSAIAVAYEPVWAIGTGETATPEQAQEVHAYLRASLGPAGDTVKILYGGSVKAANAAALFAQPDVDGGLVGGASLVAEEFLDIVAAAG